MKKQTASKDAPKPKTPSALDISPAYLNMVYALKNHDQTLALFAKAVSTKAFSIVEQLLSRAWMLWADKRFSHITSLSNELERLDKWLSETPKFPALCPSGANKASLELVSRHFASLREIARIRDEYQQNGASARLLPAQGVLFVEYLINKCPVIPTPGTVNELILRFRHPFTDIAGFGTRDLPDIFLPIQAFLITEAWFAELDAAIELLALANPKGSS